MSGLIVVTDIFIIASGTSRRHVRTLAEETELALKADDRRPLRREGLEDGTRLGRILLHLRSGRGIRDPPEECQCEEYWFRPGHRSRESRHETGWTALPYVWNDDQNEAFLEIAGDTRYVGLTAGDEAGDITYFVANSNQCANCHTPDDSKCSLIV